MDAPEVVERTAVPYVAVRREITMQTFDDVNERFPELFALLERQRIEPAGPPLLRYRVIDMERSLQVEAGVPVPSRDVEVEGEVQLLELPAGRYAVARHHGHPDSLEVATAELLRWADE